MNKRAFRTRQRRIHLLPRMRLTQPRVRVPPRAPHRRYRAHGGKRLGRRDQHTLLPLCDLDRVRAVNGRPKDHLCEQVIPFAPTQPDQIHPLRPTTATKKSRCSLTLSPMTLNGGPVVIKDLLLHVFPKGREIVGLIEITGEPTTTWLTNPFLNDNHSQPRTSVSATYFIADELKLPSLETGRQSSSHLQFFIGHGSPTRSRHNELTKDLIGPLWLQETH